MSSAAFALKLENVCTKKRADRLCDLNRPKVHERVEHEDDHELRSAFEDARDDSAVRGVILTGAARKSFAAGADIGRSTNNTPFKRNRKLAWAG